MFAALYADADAVRRLLAAGADPNVATEAGSTPLMLAVDDAAKTTLLLEAGANPNARPDDGRTALILAAMRRGAAPVLTLLLDKGADPKALSVNRTNALRQAAAAGDADAMRVLIDRGADLRADAAALVTPALQARCVACLDLVAPALDARALGASMIALARTGDVDSVQLLLDRGVDVNARDNAGRTALMSAQATDYYPLEVVRLLLARGADVNAAATNGDTAVSLAAARGGAMVDLLVKAGATLAPPAPSAPLAPLAPIPAHTARSAVSLSLPLLQKTDDTFLKKSGCVSCHNNSLTAMTLDTARRFRLPVDETLAASHRTRIPPFLEGWRESALHGIGIPGGQDTVSYILMGMAAARVPADAASDAMARYLLGLQLADGRWRLAVSRPPIESSDFEVTAATMRSLQAYAPPARGVEYAQAVARGARWLASATPTSTEDRAFQLLGLAWAGGDRTTITRLGQALLREQRADGGWSPIGPSAMPANAYSTGQALTALREAGVVPISAPAYRRGVQYLLDTQQADGSWLVRNRTAPVQAFFESDFPHGRDQFVSVAGTNWATMALIPVAVADTAGSR
jgi:ankyrin repeat protein